jgi:Cu+-exporting ATPase
VIGLAVLTVVLTLIATGDAPRAFTAGVAVLIVACPCALGLATPTALLVGTGRGAQLGLLIKGPEVLESTRRADVVVLDKTGTVTTGQMTVHGVVAGAEADTAELLRVAGALESASEHPIGAAIAAAAGPERCELFDFAATAGLGLRGTVVDSGRTYHAVVGRPQLLVEQAIAVPDEVAAAAATAEAQGRTAVLVGWNGAARGVIVVGDVVKPTSVAAIAELRALGLRPMLLTGDNRRAAEAIAAEVGIAVADIRADARPEDKVAQIETLRGDGHVVAMVGDGVNDAAALAAADLGLAVGAGADVAVEASDLTLVRNDLAAAVDAIRLSRRTLATIKGNLVWAFGYNVVLIPVAALGWLNPMLAGAAMALSSLFVVTNSLRLRRFRGWEPAVDQLQQPLAQERELVRR